MMGSLFSFVAVVAFGQSRIEPERLSTLQIGKEVVVEGVVQSQSGQGDAMKLRLERCKATFLATETELREVRPRDNIEITGIVKRRDPAGEGDGAVIVQVRNLRRLPSDGQRFDGKARGLTDDNYRGWQELAKWATRRFELYQDSEIGARARIAWQNAFTAERKAVGGNAKLLRQLRDRLRSQKVVDSFDFNGLEHEILRAEFASLVKPTTQDLRGLANEVRELLLPADAQPIEPISLEDQNRYRAEPGSWYLLANPSMRRRIARFWQALLLDQANQLELEQLKGDADAVLSLAESAAGVLADYPSLVRSFTKQTFEVLSAGIDRLGDRETDRLAGLVESVLSDKKLALEMRKNWLRGQLDRLKATERQAADQARRLNAALPILDAPTRLHLAETWLAWFPNQPDARSNAAQLLKEALGINPKLDQAESKLRSLGYRPRGPGIWESLERGSGLAAGRDGPSTSIKVGDKGERVRELLGAPTVQTRTIGKDWISHVWQYEGVTYVLREDMRSGFTLVTSIHSKLRTVSQNPD